MLRDDARCELSPLASSSILAHQPDSHDWIGFRKEPRRRPTGSCAGSATRCDGRYRCRAILFWCQEIKLFTFPLAAATLLPLRFPLLACVRRARMASLHLRRPWFPRRQSHRPASDVTLFRLVF